MIADDQLRAPLRRNRVAALAMIFVAELIGLAVLYQFFASFECRGTDAYDTCQFLKRLVTRALVMLAVAAILVRARPAAFGQWFAAASEHEGRAARSVHLVGLALLAAPFVIAAGGDFSASFDRALLFWIVGGLLAAGGGLMWLAPSAAWWQLLLRDGRVILPLLALAFLIPDLADLARLMWDWQVLTYATFAAVSGLLHLASASVTVRAEESVIGVDNFFVYIARECSGVEGFGLVLAFVGIYALVFRSQVRLGRVLLVLLPFGIALSWVLNVARIAFLVLIGANLSPELAVSGFHSYAGWLFFTLLAFVLIWLAQRVRWLHRDGQALAPVRPLRRDPVAAAILPFVVFMIGGTLLAAILPVPGVGVPLLTLLLGLCLACFLPVYSRIDWRPDPMALIAGGIVGAGWIMTAPPPDLRLEAMLAGMPMTAFVIWASLRVIGTAVFVPMVEEMFFRGYVQARIAGAGASPLWRLAALVFASLGFAALHGRWIEAGLAGLAFGLVMMRRGRVSDAVWSHAIANAIVAAAAVLQREWSLI